MVVFSGGGTGGHLYPALAIADALRLLRPDVRVFFVGARRGLEARVLPERGEEHLLLPVQGIDRARLLGNWRALTGLAVGLRTVFRLFGERRPEVVVVTGGYAGAAAGIAAGLMGVPLVLQEQNSVPGAVTKLLSRFATHGHVAFPEAATPLGMDVKRLTVSGNPVRSPSRMESGDARRTFGITADVPVALVTGGSQGSLALNRCVVSFVENVIDGQLERPGGLNLLWSTGPQHFAAVEAALRAAGSPEWVHALPYIEDVSTALAAADLAVSRAGAMSTAELLNQGLPAILIPLPTAAADHQLHNARALEAVGAARVVEEASLTPSALARELAGLIQHPDRLAEMRARALKRAHPNATDEIARDVAQFLPPSRGLA
jgi:UDP-N-acetylglucosamine--N-acetylmuramyl-(pentapeptide) pyrophosphoryl-undecaprenol N-acetylglucosamine transferase